VSRARRSRAAVAARHCGRRPQRSPQRSIAFRFTRVRHGNTARVEQGSDFRGLTRTGWIISSAAASGLGRTWLNSWQRRDAFQIIRQEIAVERMAKRQGLRFRVGSTGRIYGTTRRHFHRADVGGVLGHPCFDFATHRFSSVFRTRRRAIQREPAERFGDGGRLPLFVRFCGFLIRSSSCLPLLARFRPGPRRICSRFPVIPASVLRGIKVARVRRFGTFSARDNNFS